MAYQNNTNEEQSYPKKRYNNGPNRRKQHVPVTTKFQEDLKSVIEEQMRTFLRDHDTADDKRKVENELFSFGIGTWYAEFSDHPDYIMYIVDRSIRTDRETHKLSRASCSIIVMNKTTHMPAYFAYAFLTNHKTGSVSVVPMNPLDAETGPDYRNAARSVITTDTESSAEDSSM